jgi:hypothetical protein
MQSTFKAYLIGSIALLAVLAHAVPKLESIPEDFTEIRDPLVPPGITVTKVDRQEEDLQRDTMTAQIVWPQLQLKGITHTGRSNFIAIIDQVGIVEEGDLVQLRQGDLLYTWRIDRIKKEGIASTRMHVAPVDQPQRPIQVLTPQTKP